MKTPNNAQTILFSAGEPSGDILGAEILIELQKIIPINAAGFVGPNLEESGVRPIGSIDELSVMGFSNVIATIPQILECYNRILAWVDHAHPSLAILVDYPGFHLRLGEQLKLRKIPVIQVVAPQFWAWGQSRLKRLHSQVDHVLGILPFEAEIFKPYKIPYSYIGTPIADRILEFKKTLIPEERPKKLRIGFFPGSRLSEWQLIFPIMKKVMVALEKIKPDIELHLSLGDFFPAPVLNTIQNMIDSTSQELKKPPQVTLGNSLQLMSSVDVALMCSGTACLECALIGTPLAAIYQMNSLNYKIAKNLVKISLYTLPNLIAGKKIIEEFIQIDESQIEKIADHLLMLAENRGESTKNLDDLWSHLKIGAGRNAAEIISGLLTSM